MRALFAVLIAVGVCAGCGDNKSASSPPPAAQPAAARVPDSAGTAPAAAATAPAVGSSQQPAPDSASPERLERFKGAEEFVEDRGKREHSVVDTEIRQ